MAGPRRDYSCVVNVCRRRTSNRQPDQGNPGVVKEKKHTGQGLFQSVCHGPKTHSCRQLTPGRRASIGALQAGPAAGTDDRNKAKQAAAIEAIEGT